MYLSAQTPNRTLTGLRGSGLTSLCDWPSLDICGDPLDISQTCYSTAFVYQCECMVCVCTWCTCVCCMLYVYGICVYGVWCVFMVSMVVCACVYTHAPCTHGVVYLFLGIKLKTSALYILRNYSPTELHLQPVLYTLGHQLNTEYLLYFPPLILSIPVSLFPIFSLPLFQEKNLSTAISYLPLSEPLRSSSLALKQQLTRMLEMSVGDSLVAPGWWEVGWWMQRLGTRQVCCSAS